MSKWWLTLKRQAIGRALDTLERDADTLAGRVDLGTIAIAARPSMIATQPPA